MRGLGRDSPCWSDPLSVGCVGKSEIKNRIQRRDRFVPTNCAVTPVVRRFGALRTLGVGVASTLAGMAWLSTVDLGSSYVIHMALPMMLIGAGQGLALAPMTDYCLADVRLKDSGAASG